MRTLLFLALVGMTVVSPVAQAAARAPYDGYWAANAADCHDKEGVNHLSILAGAFDWYETHCRAGKALAGRGRTWTVPLACRGEGQRFSARSRLSMPTPGKLVFDQSPVGPGRRQVYVRCKAP